MSVMVGLLPTHAEWAKHGFPHMTLVYCGKTDSFSPTDYNEIGKVASEVAKKHRSLELLTLAHRVFGDQPEQVDVFTLRSTTELAAIRSRFLQWNESEYPFTPHVTIGPRSSYVPEMPFSIVFDRIIVKWGEQDLTFWLNPT